MNKYLTTILILLIIVIILTVVFFIVYFRNAEDENDLNSNNNINITQNKNLDINRLNLNLNENTNSTNENVNEDINENINKNLNTSNANANTNSNSNTNTNSNSNINSNTNSSAKTIEGWGEYTSENLGFKIQYHPSWYYSYYDGEGSENYVALYGFALTEEEIEAGAPFPIELRIVSKYNETEYSMIKDGEVEGVTIIKEQGNLIYALFSKTEYNDIKEKMSTTFELN